ncbi:MAG TPA: nuclear transport factor 2 family protein [Terriglobales bacterium]
MRIPVLLCLLFALFSSAEAQTKSADTTAEESKLIALENAWNQAQLHHDSKALDSLVSDRFVYTDYDGSVLNKAQFLADIKDPAYRASLMANENVKVYLYQNAAVITGTYHSKGTYRGIPFDHWGRFTDTWIYQSGKWQCVASHTTLIPKK